MPGVQLDDGSVIEEYDGETITVISPSGRRTRMLRDKAPQRFKDAADQYGREQAPAAQPAPESAPGESFDHLSLGALGAPLARAGEGIRDAFMSLPGPSALAEEAQAQPPQEPPPMLARPQEQEPAGRPQGRVTFAQPAGGGRTAASGPQSATATETTRTVDRTRMSPEDRKALEASRGRLAEAGERVAQGFRDESVDQALIGQERRDVYADQEAKLGEFAQERSDVARANANREQLLRDQQDALMREIQDFRIDEGRLWRNKSTGQKVAAGIGAFLGGFLSKGKSNSTLDMIEAEIDRDINLQRERLKGKNVALGKIEGLYARARQQGLDELASVQAAKDSYLSMVQARLGELSGRAKDTQTQAALRREADKVAMRREENLQKYLANTGQKVRTTTRSKKVPVAGGIAGGEYPGIHPTGERTAPLTKQEKQDLAKAAGALPKLLANLDKMVEIRADKGTEYWDSGAVARYKAAAHSVKGVLSIIGETGVLREADEKRIAKFLPEISDYSPRQELGVDPTLNKLKEVRAQFIRDADAGMRGRFGYTFDLAQGSDLKTRRRGVAR